nr:transposase [Pedobacter mendelii]
MKKFEKLFGDKGYIFQNLFEILFTDGIHLVAGIHNKMKNSLMRINEKIMLRKRLVIETVNDELKNICQIEHFRHRSFTSFIVNILAGHAAYSFFKKNFQSIIKPLKRPITCPLIIELRLLILIYYLRFVFPSGGIYIFTLNGIS